MKDDRHDDDGFKRREAESGSVDVSYINEKRSRTVPATSEA
jgi:hypothetical protein